MPTGDIVAVIVMDGIVMAAGGLMTIISSKLTLATVLVLFMNPIMDIRRQIHHVCARLNIHISWNHGLTLVAGPGFPVSML